MRIFFTTLLLASILTSGLAQTVRRVNNNPGITGTNVYSTFALAHTAAAANDIIIIEPSPTSYGSIILTKPLKIYGNGYFLDTNTELKVDRRSSVLDLIEFNTGSGGSEIYGLTYANSVIYGVSNITISRCYLYSNLVSIVNTNKAGTTTTNVSNIFISRTYSINQSGQPFVSASPTTGFTISNVQITNNLIAAPGISAGNTVGIQNWIVRHNTFLTGSVATLANAVFENNLLLGGGGVSFTNVTFNNNISVGATFPSETNGNRNNYSLIDPETSVSQLVGTGTGISADEQYQVKPGVELKTLGSGGSEVGAYGGVTPYVISGIPPIPSIVDLINTGTGDNANPLKVNITVKSNN
jgi:hypothetical protein